MKKNKKQLIILLAASVIIGSGLPNNLNLNNPNDSGDNHIGASDSGEKEDNELDNSGGESKPNCDEEEKPFSD